MHKLFIRLLILMMAGLCNAVVMPADFYLSPNGSDTWSGTLAEPNAQKSDGPFATLERARDAVRVLKKTKSTDITVLIRGGTYRLDKTVVFGLDDSGDNNQSITYAAYPDETPVFSSGHEIRGWKKVTGKLPGLPAAAQGRIWAAPTSNRFLTLYDADGMLPRAQSERFAALKGSKANQLVYPEGKLKDWPNVTDVEIMVRPTREWTMNVLPLKSVDEKKGVAHTAINATYSINKLGVWLENVLEELDEPGEWVLNTKEQMVYLWPRGKTPVVAPTLLELLRIEGKIDKDGPTDIPVRNLRFRGLTFMHGERYTLNDDDSGTQHDWDMFDKDNAMFRLRGAENCAIEQCHFLHSGSSAIRVDLYGMNNEISGNHIEYMGANGIFLCGYPPGTKDVNKNNLVYNNHIHHVGLIYWQSPGIFLCQSGENRVANNLIHHTNYSGMIISGIVTRFFEHSNKRESSRSIRWQEVDNVPKNPELEDIRPYMHCRNNIIEYNEIHNVMQMLGDGNGIYIRGAGPGNVIRRNYIHDLVAKTGKQSGMRTDGGQMDTLIAENLIFKCNSQGVTLKLNNRFENNIIADIGPPRSTYLKIVEGPMKGASNLRNIFYSTEEGCTFIAEPGEGKGNVGEDSRGRETARMADVDSDYNIYFCKADRSPGKDTLETLQDEGVDANSLAVDPMFVNPEKGDFRFKSGSPALKMGIIPFDMSKVGLRE
jgi:hypothetical protein